MDAVDPPEADRVEVHHALTVTGVVHVGPVASVAYRDPSRDREAVKLGPNEEVVHHFGVNNGGAEIGWQRRGPRRWQPDLRLQVVGPRDLGEVGLPAGPVVSAGVRAWFDPAWCSLRGELLYFLPGAVASCGVNAWDLLVAEVGYRWGGVAIFSLEGGGFAAAGVAIPLGPRRDRGP